MTKRDFLIGVVAFFTTMLCFTSCDDDDEKVIINQATITVEIPNNIDTAEISNVEFQLINVETLDTITVVGTYTINNNIITFVVDNLPEGTYNIVVRGHMNFTTNNGMSGEQDFELSKNNTEFTVETTEESLNISTFTANSSFVLSELYIAGALSSTNNTYNYDAYFIITNNSEATLYADSIAIIESAYNSQATGYHEWNPDFRPEAFSAQAVFMIPGNGKTYPVAPGKSIVIANNAMDHTTVNDGSLDLTNADFEVFLDNGANSMDIDYNVPNLENIYCYTNTIWIPSVQMNRSYGIARMQQNKETFLANHSETPTYIAVTGKTMESKEVQVPNEWILDAVNLGQEDDFEWYVISETLDAGFAIGRENKSDIAQRGTSVIRKMENGKYVDTNNSTNDFLIRQTPSLK